MDRMGETLANKLLTAIDESRTRPLSRLLFGLGIRHVGEHTARILAKRFDSFSKLATATEEELKNIHEIGDKVAESLSEYFRNPDNIALINKLTEAGVNPTGEAVVQTDGILSGKTVVITGTLDQLSRKEAEALVEQLGGRAAGSVSTKTSLLVAGPGAGSKLAKAQQLGIQIISEDDFLNLVNFKGQQNE